MHAFSDPIIDKAPNPNTIDDHDAVDLVLDDDRLPRRVHAVRVSPDVAGSRIALIQ